MVRKPAGGHGLFGRDGLLRRPVCFSRLPAAGAVVHHDPGRGTPVGRHGSGEVAETVDLRTAGGHCAAGIFRRHQSAGSADAAVCSGCHPVRDDGFRTPRVLQGQGHPAPHLVPAAVRGGPGGCIWGGSSGFQPIGRIPSILLADDVVPVGAGLDASPVSPGDDRSAGAQSLSPEVCPAPQQHPGNSRQNRYDLHDGDRLVAAGGVAADLESVRRLRTS